MIAALFADRKSPEKFGALRAELSYKGGVTNTIYLSTVPYTTSRILTSTSKVKLIIYVDEIV